MKIAVVGGGISGISAARLLHDRADVTVYEANDKIGGLIRCDYLDAGLYHKLGGHVFNTKSPAVSEWFWRHFDREGEFHYLTRDARILLGDAKIGYPLENHLYQLPETTCRQVIDDLIAHRTPAVPTANFKEFLATTFGPTLCDTYFYPYNEKIWQCDLSTIPLGWLEGKLPMPKLAEILRANVLRTPETSMVHARFYYPKHGGSQFVVDRLAEGLNIRLNTAVRRLTHQPSGRWQVNDEADAYDRVVYCSDVRTLGNTVPALAGRSDLAHLRSLRTRGITNAFCRCDTTATSWLYIPDRTFRSNRIIYTGAFAPANNRGERMTCVVEFLHGESLENIRADLRRLPGNLELIATNDVRDAYVIQEPDTRAVITALLTDVRNKGLHLLGRFAEWEYYNADKCMESAMRVAAEIS